MHEEAKIDVFLNMLFLAFLIGIAGTLIVLILGAYEILPLTVSCIIVAVIIFFIAVFTKSYKIPAILFFTLWFIGLSSNIIFYKDALHLASPFWLIIINMLVIYVLGIYFGLTSLLLSAIVFIYYLKYEFQEGIARLEKLSTGAIQSVYVEVIFAMATLGYILWIIIEHGRRSDIVLASKNQALVEQNSTIKASNEEKSVMLKEIHHRVKNNLQIITSLLRLQMEEIENKQARDKFKESINRVIAMALIHEKIYQSDQLNHINIQEYFHSLGSDLIQSYQINKKIHFRLDVSTPAISVEKLIPLALVFNELMTNSLKHAFVDTEKPCVDVELYSVSAAHFMFVYKDNGKWVDTPKENSLGRELIQSFCEQMDAEMVFEKDQQTTYSFKIPFHIVRPVIK